MLGDIGEIAAQAMQIGDHYKNPKILIGGIKY
jgi:hypothetical protein